MSDVDRFERFLREFQDMVFATAVRLLGRPADAEDVAQTVFLRAFERFDELDGSPTVAGWLKTVTTRECLNHLSRHRARWRLFSEISDVSGPSGDRGRFEDRLAASESSAPDYRPAEKLEELRLEEALRDLPDHQRVPLVLFHFERYDYQQIATTLGVSLGKVKTDIHRGRLALKAVLSDRTDA